MVNLVLALLLAATSASAQVVVDPTVVEEARIRNAWHLDFLGINPEGRHIDGLGTVPRVRLFLQGVRVDTAGGDTTFAAVSESGRWLKLTESETLELFSYGLVDSSGTFQTVYDIVKDLAWRNVIGPRVGIADSVLAWTQIVHPPPQ